MVFADGRMVERVEALEATVTQLESEVAILQDDMAERKQFIDALQANLLALQADPAVIALRASVEDEDN